MVLTNQEQLELQKLLEAKYLEKVKSNYAEYVEYVHDGLYEHNRHTLFLCDAIQQAIDTKKRMATGEIKTRNQYITISIPPRHGKSMTITETLVSYYLGQFPNHRVILGSYGSDFAMKFGKKNREKFEQYGEKLFNLRLKRGTQSATDWDIEGHRGGTISRGITSGVTGEGADLMIIDDPVKSREEADSEVYRNKVWNEWVDSFSTRLHPGAIVIVIMTRWHEDDLVGRLLNPEYGDPLPWKVINLAMEADDPNDPLGREIGEPLWPERYGKEFIEERKKYPSSFNALYQGRPTSQQGNLLRRDWWQYYDELPELDMLILSVDATFKDGKDTDYVAIQVWGKFKANMYMIDNLKARMNFPATLQAIKNMLAKHPGISAKYVEDKANGPAIIAMLNKDIGGFIAVQPEGGKVARVNAISPFIEAGNAFLPRDASWVHDFIEECASFPKGKHDDQVDAMSQALNQLSVRIKHDVIFDKPTTITFDDLMEASYFDLL